MALRKRCWLPSAATVVALLLLSTCDVTFGQVLAGVNMTIPAARIPADPLCSTAVARPIPGGVCPALACPPCVRQHYEAAFSLANVSLAQALVPVTAYLNPAKCPFSPSGWLYNPANDRCYYKSSYDRGISAGITDAINRCFTLHAGASILNIADAQEEEFVRLNLLYAGFFGETYTFNALPSCVARPLQYMLRMPLQAHQVLVEAGMPSSMSHSVSGAVLHSAKQATDYHNFNEPGRGFDYYELEVVCMEILPNKPKYYNPFSCAVLKQYICERSVAQPGETFGPGPTPQLPCTGPPAAPAGALRTVSLVNAGGPAFCGFSADTAALPVAVGGTAAVRFGNPTCNGCRGLPTYACLACSTRTGDIRYTVPGLTPGNRYTLRLTFSEDYWTEPGRRLINVDVDGTRVISALDAYALAGARFTPVNRNISVTATQASITMRVSAAVDQGVLAALEVYDMGPAGPSSPGVSSPTPTSPPASSPPPASVSPVPSSPSPTSPSPVPTSPSPAVASSPSPSPVPCSTPALPPGALSAVARINFGGPAICGFAADTGATPAPGAVTATGSPENWYTLSAACSTCAANPSTACLACTVRFGSPVSITVPGVIPGNAYTLRFTFSEVWWAEAGQRAFNVIVGGSRVLTGIDPYALAGARFVSVVMEANVTASTGSLVVSVVPTADNGIIAALEWQPATAPLPALLLAREVWWAVAGARLFDVRVNGASVLTGIDPYALAGGRQFTAAVREVLVAAPVGAIMTVSFVATRDNAILAGFEVSTTTAMLLSTLRSAVKAHHELYQCRLGPCTEQPHCGTRLPAATVA
ncbi:hypothetical protein COO60DRAFT_1466015 [Scenedesmus sp. NREL 46B-D3]|nr:hypothetical protein COO60DRAFT_1466015 [Scenedesmus sp. NREL 46B-D3]